MIYKKEVHLTEYIKILASTGRIVRNVGVLGKPAFIKDGIKIILKGQE